MKKLLFSSLLLVVLLLVSACQSSNTETNDVSREREVYQLLIETENLSGMTSSMGRLIATNGSLGLPTSYKGVSITYTSRNPEIISHEGVVTQPNSCWIQSKDQQGVVDFPNLNDNWPVVIDVLIAYEGQQRTAKLLFTVAPAPGFTCDKYLG